MPHAPAASFLPRDPSETRRTRQATPAAQATSTLPSSPPPQQQQQAPVNAPTPDPELVGQWEEFLRKPETQAALLQFGVSLLNPRVRGGTAQVGDALGQAGAAVGRVQDTQRAGEQQQFERGQQERKTQVSERGVDVSQQRADLQAQQISQQAEQAEAAGGREQERIGLQGRGVDLQERQLGLTQQQIDIQRQRAEQSTSEAIALASRELKEDQLRLFKDVAERNNKIYTALLDTLAPGDPIPDPPTTEQNFSQYNVLKDKLLTQPTVIEVPADISDDMIRRGVERGGDDFVKGLIKEGLSPEVVERARFFNEQRKLASSALPIPNLVPPVTTSPSSPAQTITPTPAFQGPIPSERTRPRRQLNR